MDAFSPSSRATRTVTVSSSPPLCALPVARTRDCRRVQQTDRLFVTALTVANMLVAAYDLYSLGIGLR